MSISLAFLAAAATQRMPQAQQRSNLRSQLDELGIMVIPDHLVLEHKRHELDRLRLGSLRYWTPVLNAVILVLEVVSAFRFTVRRHGELIGLPLWLACMAVCAIGAACMNAWHSDIGTLLFGIPSLAGALAFILAMALNVSGRTLNRATSHWERMPLREWQNGLPLAASSIADRIGFPRVALKVEYLRDDPFLVAERGWGPFRESAYVAAWGTGNQRLDRFADYI